MIVATEEITYLIAGLAAAQGAKIVSDFGSTAAVGPSIAAGSFYAQGFETEFQAVTAEGISLFLGIPVASQKA